MPYHQPRPGNEMASLLPGAGGSLAVLIPAPANTQRIGLVSSLTVARRDAWLRVAHEP